MFIINFHKGMAYPFVEMPMDELTDLVVDGQLVMTDEILTIRDKILESKDSTQMFERAESHLLDVFGTRLVPHPYIAYAVGRIVQQPGALTMEALAKKVGYSGKHLVKLFRDHVGLTPKTFLRIIRFQQAIADMESHRNMDWSSIAHDSGYYDQAHFINDFRHFSGFTPQEYASLQGNYRNYVAVG
jgi:AraC-like DNA-binding protein